MEVMQVIFTITFKLLCYLLPNYTDPRLKSYLKEVHYILKIYFCFVHMHACQVYSWRVHGLEVGGRFSGAGIRVIGDCKSPDIDVRN